MVEIDNRNIFFEKLRTGINLFTGAGFSVLADKNGNKLPNADELDADLCEKFDVKEAYAKDLEKLCSVLKFNRKTEFHEYLIERFKLTDYNEKYNAIDKINLSSIITTNIDNLLPLVIDQSKRYYLDVVSYNGTVKRDGQAVYYIPLHGTVLDDSSEMYFGKAELCNVNNHNRGLFAMMHSELLKKPTLFWGYGFHDGSVMQTISQLLEENVRQDIWVQLRKGSENIDYFRALGLNVIIADTDELLDEISKELAATSKPVTDASTASENKVWKSLEVPNLGSKNIVSVPINNFYELGETSWYYVLTNKIYFTSYVNRAIDCSIKARNTLIVGIALGGKTTLLMQIACRIGKQVYFVSDLNDSKAKLICNNVVPGQEYIVLVDNCAEDMKAYRRLCLCPSIRTIATCDDVMYESSRHILDGIDYKKIEITDIERNEAQRIYETVPADIRKASFTYRQNDTEKYSFLELTSLNVKNVISQDKVKKALARIQKQNQEAFEIILLAAYLSRNSSALSTDVLIAYYNIRNIDEILKKIELVKSYLSELHVSIDSDGQDYFSLRSGTFVRYVQEVACKSYKDTYGRIIKRFVESVPPCFIYKNNVFRRTAYDSKLLYQVFGNDADDVYKEIYHNDASAYTLQQWALYKALTGRYQEAFSDIDEAIHLQPNNFSVRNARAIILFRANKDKDTEEAKSSLDDSMQILEKCYQSDKRKVYHAQTFAEFALELSKYHNDSSYIAKAYTWLNELILHGESTSRRTRALFNMVKEIQSSI